MKRLIIYSGIFISSFILYLAFGSTIGFFETIILPFTLIGDLLRMMSEQGGFLNILAWIVLIAISLLPFVLLKIWKNYNSKGTWVFSISLSVSFYFTILNSINAFVVLRRIDPLFSYVLTYGEIDYLETLYVYAFASVFYSILLGYGCYRLVTSSKISKHKLFTILVDIISVVLIYSYILTYTERLKIVHSNVFAKIFNMTYIMMNFLLMYLFLLILITIIDIMREIGKDKVSDMLIKKVKHLRYLSIYSIAGVLGTNVLFNILNIALMHKLESINFVLDIPITLILACTFTYLFSEYINKVNILEEESSLII